MDRFEAMTLLIAVVDEGSFTAAARKVAMPATTLSRKIAELERGVGAALLFRTTRKVSLTEAGAVYVAKARRIVALAEEAEREAAGEFTEPKGELVLTAPVQFGQLHVLPVVAAFLAQHPHIDVRLLLADRNVQLVEDHVDMAVRIGRLPDSSLVATQIGTMRTVVCARPSLLRAHGMPRTPADLAHLPCVVLEGPWSGAHWAWRDPTSQLTHAVDVRPRLTVTSVEGVLGAAVRGVGVARLLHYQVAEAVAARALRIVLEPYEVEPAPVSLLHATRGHMPLKLRRFLDFAAPRLRKTLTKIARA
jgi:DNA-binding transcriptional LysR family regulator